MKLATKEDVYRQFEIYHDIVKQCSSDNIKHLDVDYKSIIDKMYFSPGCIKEIYTVDEEKFTLNDEEVRCRIWAWKGPVTCPDDVDAIKADAVYVYMPLFITGVLQNGINPLMQTTAGASWYYSINQVYD